jgi:hypothetical protein
MTITTSRLDLPGEAWKPARIETAHFVLIRYHGATDYKPSRLSVSWEGWPTQGAKTVRKAMPYTSERDDMARDAAKLFTDWLSDMPGDEDPLRYSPAALTLASMGNGEWALLVKTHVTPRGCDKVEGGAA